MKLLLTTLHAKYSHASLALPCLAGYCSSISGLETVIAEYTVNEPREQILQRIVAFGADVVAFSCYIWNIEETLRLVSDLKKIDPRIITILGGPEASYGIFELMDRHRGVDYVVQGEGEAPLKSLLEALLAGLPMEACGIAIPGLFHRDGEDIVSPPRCAYLPLDNIPSPFRAGLVNTEKPLVYYETSRGCPFSCAFCLSSLEGQVRTFSPERIESDLAWLMEHKVPQIKLVDRTFNYDARRANRIWSFILDHNRSSHFHFEIAADLLTDENLRLLQQVPPDTFRFEIGIQSSSSDVLRRAGRMAELSRICENVRRLRSESVIELHLDLLAGLPGETYGGMLDSLQLVADLHPQVIQIEPLKVLKGSPMRAIAQQEGYRHSDFPPYTILSTPWLSFNEIRRIEVIGRLLDLFHNRGGFTAALAELADSLPFASLFDSMAKAAEGEQLSGLSRQRLYELFHKLVRPLHPGPAPLLADALFFDFCSGELPRQGKLPSFMNGRESECRWPGGERSTSHDGSRSRKFRFTFLRDYRTEPWGEYPVEITFLYTSAPGAHIITTI